LNAAARGRGDKIRARPGWSREDRRSQPAGPKNTMKERIPVDG